MRKKYPGVTLIELLIAIVLLSIVTLGFFSIEVFSRHHVLTADRRAKLQNEVSFVLEHISKNVNMAIGTITDPAVVAYSDDLGFRVRIDTPSGNGAVGTNDPWIAYRHVNLSGTPLNSEIRYYSNAGTGSLPSGNWESIGRNILQDSGTTHNFDFDLHLDSSGNHLQNYIDITITARWNPNPAVAVSPDNPEVRMRTRINMPMVSMR